MQAKNIHTEEVKSFDTVDSAVEFIVKEHASRNVHWKLLRNSAVAADDEKTHAYHWGAIHATLVWLIGLGIAFLVYMHAFR